MSIQLDDGAGFSFSCPEPDSQQTQETEIDVSCCYCPPNYICSSLPCRAPTGTFLVCCYIDWSLFHVDYNFKIKYISKAKSVESSIPT